MKKITTIIGAGIVSMAVGFSPVFAQMAPKPQEPASTTATVQPKADEKAPLTAPAPKDAKTLPAKPGADAKSGAVQDKDKAAAKDEKSKPEAGIKSGKDEKSVKTDTKLPEKQAKPGNVEKAPAKADSTKASKDEPQPKDTQAKGGTVNPVKPPTTN